MAGSGEKIVEDIIGALSTAIVLVIRSLEQQLRGDINRHTIAVALRDAQNIPNAEQ